MKKNSPLNLSQNIKFLEKYRTVDLSNERGKFLTERELPNKTPSHIKLNLKMNTNLNKVCKNPSMKKLFLELDAKFYDENQENPNTTKRNLKKKKLLFRTESANLSKYCKFYKQRN